MSPFRAAELTIEITVSRFTQSEDKIQVNAVTSFNVIYEIEKKRTCARKGRANLIPDDKLTER